MKQLSTAQRKLREVATGPSLTPVSEFPSFFIFSLNIHFNVNFPPKVFIFDFGSELYVWTGQQSLSNKRKVAFHLAEMLYSQQFDCEGVVSPIDPRRPMQRSSSLPVYRDADGTQRGRPAWTLFAKLHEKAETLLFQEKFFDWPDPTKIIKMKGHVSSGEISEVQYSVIHGKRIPLLVKDHFGLMYLYSHIFGVLTTFKINRFR